MINPLKFVIMTDTHYYSKRNWIAGNYNDLPPANGQLLHKYSEEIVRHTFDELSRDDFTDIILISGDLIGYPPVYRKIEISPNDRKIDVKTVFVDNVTGIDTKGLTLTDYIKKLFLGSIEDAVENAVNDYEKFADFAVGMSAAKKTSYKYKFLIQKAAGFLNRLTFGKVWKFVRFSSDVSSSEIKAVYDKKAVPFMIDVAANLFKGDADIEKSSVEYRVAEALIRKIDKLLKPFSKKLKKIGINNIASVVLPLIHNDGLPDADAVLYY